MIRRFFIYVFLIFIFSCENAPEFDNPLDPENPDFTQPDTFIILGPDQNEIVSTSTIELSWSGNDDIYEYRFQYDDFEWSDWSIETSTILTFLDEGEHAFQVMGRYTSLDEDETPDSLQFVVNAIDGPSLRVFPLHLSADVGSTVNIHIYLEEVENIMASEIFFTYDPLHAVLQSVQEGSMINEFSGESVFITDEIEWGVVQIDLGVALGDDPGVYNSGAYIELTFQLVSKGEFTIDILDSSQLRDNNNNTIIINSIVDGIVQIN